MNLEWTQIGKAVWQIFWVLGAYSYVVCGIVGTYRSMQAKKAGTGGLNMDTVDKTLETFIVSPFYVGTMYSLLAVMFFWRGGSVMHSVAHNAVAHMIIVGVSVVLSTIVLEIIEASITKHEPLRVFGDRDAMRLTGIALIVIAVTTSVAVISN